MKHTALKHFSEGLRTTPLRLVLKSGPQHLKHRWLIPARSPRAPQPDVYVLYTVNGERRFLLEDLAEHLEVSMGSCSVTNSKLRGACPHCCPLQECSGVTQDLLLGICSHLRCSSLLRLSTLHSNVPTM